MQGHGRTSVDVVRSQQLQGETNVNTWAVEQLGRYGQAPEGPRDSDVASRPSRRQVAFYFKPSWWQVEAFGGRLAFGSPLASQPPGDQLDDTERNNIDRPSSGPLAATLYTWSGDSASLAPSMPGA
jgi:hypothetical protein